MNDPASVIRCIVVDDEPLALELLGDYIGKASGFRLVLATSNPVEALEAARNQLADLVFLDMQMPELTGLQFLRILQQKTLVVITTAYPEYALEGYEHHVVDYLLKPITFERFLVTIAKIRERVKGMSGAPATGGSQPAEPESIFIKVDNRLMRIDLDEIMYLEGARDYVILYTEKHKLLTSQSMRSLEELLRPPRFIRVHKSYIVALDKITFIQRNNVSVGNRLLPVSETYRDMLAAYTRQK